MSFRGVLGWGAASSVVVAVVMACGGSGGDAVLDPTSDGGGDAPIGSGQDGATTDAGVDAADSAPVVPPSCGNDTRPVSDFCTIEGPCTSAQCAEKDSTHYRCANSDGGTRPDIQGCNRLSDNPLGGDDWCCPRACVRVIGEDSKCSDGRKYYGCPVGQPRLAPATCTRQGNFGTAEAYCCPP